MLYLLLYLIGGLISIVLLSLNQIKEGYFETGVAEAIVIVLLWLPLLICTYGWDCLSGFIKGNISIRWKDRWNP